MDEILEQFFQSNEYWKGFKLIRILNTPHSISRTYKNGRVKLKFYHYDGASSVEVIVGIEIHVRCMFFLNLQELTLILDRVSSVRAANPLCIGPQSIRALSFASQKQ